MQITNEEVDLSIPNMQSLEDEARAGVVLRQLPGVTGVRLVKQGAWVSYHPETVSHDEIRAALRQAGFRAGTFQDSATGEVGKSSV